MHPVLKWLKSQIIEAFKISDEVMRGKAVETIEHEVAELDNIFGILVLGAFIGILNDSHVSGHDREGGRGRFFSGGGYSGSGLLSFLYINLALQLFLRKEEAYLIKRLKPRRCSIFFSMFQKNFF